MGMPSLLKVLMLITDVLLHSSCMGSVVSSFQYTPLHKMVATITPSDSPGPLFTRCDSTYSAFSGREQSRLQGKLSQRWLMLPSEHFVVLTYRLNKRKTEPGNSFSLKL